MKKIILCLSLLLCLPSFAANNLIEFNLLNSDVTYQLNKNDGSLFAIITDAPYGVCLHKMEFKSKTNLDSVFVYERNDKYKEKNYYQKFELNLMTNQVSSFSSLRGKTFLIPIEKRECLTGKCTNISNIPVCNY